MVQVGDKIKRARQNAGLTQEELGQKIGVTGVAIMRYEKGQRKPSIETLVGISVALSTSVNDLVSETDSEDWLSLPASYTDEKIEMLAKYLDLMNESGKAEAVKRVEELTEIPRYQKEKTPSQDPQDGEGQPDS